MALVRSGLRALITACALVLLSGLPRAGASDDVGLVSVTGPRRRGSGPLQRAGSRAMRASGCGAHSGHRTVRTLVHTAAVTCRGRPSGWWQDLLTTANREIPARMD